MLIHRAIRLAERWPGVVVAAAVLITAILGVAALGIDYDPSITNLLPRQPGSGPLPEPQPAAGESEHLILFVERAELFTLDGLGALQASIDTITSLPQIVGALTPFNLITFREEDGRVRIGSLSPGGRAPTTDAELAEFERSIRAEPMARNLVLAGDYSALGTVFFIRPAEDHRELITAVEEATVALEPWYTVHLAGRITVIEAIRRNLIRDVPRFLLPAVGIILVVFYLGFRSVRSVVVPASVVIMGTVWTIGVMSLAGLSFSVVSIMVPPLVLALGSSYSIHILARYYQRQASPAAGGGLAAAATLEASRTILLAGITTMIGFLSLVTASVRQVREFGLVTSMGIFFCLVLSVLFVPAALTLMGSTKTRDAANNRDNRTDRLLERLAARIVAWRKAIVILLAAIVAAFAVSLPRVRYQTDYTAYQRPGESAIDDFLYSTRKFGGFVFLYVTLTAPANEAGYFLRNDALEPVARFEEKLRGNPDVAYVSSFPSYLVQLDRVLTGTAAIPDSRGPILLLSRLFRGLAGQPAGGSLIEELVSPEFDKLTIAVRVFDGARGRPLDEARMGGLVAELRATMDRHLDPRTSPVLRGEPLDYLLISGILSRDQLKSVFVSILLVLAVTVAGFRSFRFGLLALVPMLTGIMLTIVTMTAFGIPFDVITVMVTSVATGVGIDDSIHLLLLYRRQPRAPGKAEAREAVQRTIRAAGLPIVLTSAAIVAGLLVLALSRFVPVVYFGTLIALVLVFTTFGALVILPALLAILARTEHRR
jgi:predicted RND superfamily exporter protein